MIKSRLSDLIGIRYPIIQAGMGPFSNSNLCVATANSGVLALLSTSIDLSAAGSIYKRGLTPWSVNRRRE